MPFVENQGAKLYWDEQGSGEPLSPIMGLSYPTYMWHRSRPVLAARHRTVARGVGQSDAITQFWDFSPISLPARNAPRPSFCPGHPEHKSGSKRNAPMRVSFATTSA